MLDEVGKIGLSWHSVVVIAFKSRSPTVQDCRKSSNPGSG